MIKNVFLKKMLQNSLFSFFSVVNKRMNHNDRRILLYSNLGFRDNVKALYDFLVENKYYEKYEIVCSCNDYERFSLEKYPNVTFVNNLKGVLEYFFAGYVFYCFGKIPILPGKKQEVVQMWHGTPYKAPDEGMLKGHSWNKLYYTHILTSSAHFIPFWSYAFSFPQEKFIVCGHARNDNLKKIEHYDFGDYDKIVLWAPTFRFSKTIGYADTTKTAKVVPIFEKKQIAEVNEFLKQRRIVVVVKLHPLQDLGDFNNVEMENFVLLSHDEFSRRKMDLYKFMGQCDALITDYSSIFYDFLLLNRPMAFTVDDESDYADTRGFAVSDPEDYKPGFRIHNAEDFYRFIDDLSKNVDAYENDRKRVDALANDFHSDFSLRALSSVGITRN